MQNSPYQGGYVAGHQRMPANPQMNNGMSASMGNPMANSMNSMGNHMNNSMMNNNMMSNSVSSMSLNGPMGMNSNVMNKSMPGVGGAVQPPHAPMYGSNSPGMMSQTHRNRVTPYPSPQQHMAQKRPAQYNPMGQQYGPGMQHYGAGAQHGFNTAQVSSLLIFFLFNIS